MNNVYSSHYLFPQEFEKGYGYIILKLTLKRISVHIAFPWVIIGSWSSPFPSQQSSSTHLGNSEIIILDPYIK